MAEDKNKKVIDEGEEPVDFFVAKDPRLKGDDSIVVSVNGDEIRVKPGQKVKIKKKFAEVLQNSMEEDAKAMAFIAENAL